MPTVRDADASRSRPATSDSPPTSASTRSPARALRARDEPDPSRPRVPLNGLVPDYVERADLDDATVLAAAVRVGATRLIDNVLLEGELT